MHKKNKQSMVSDFRLQLNGMNDSPYTRETVSSMELDLCYSDKLVIDFPKGNTAKSYNNQFAVAGDLTEVSTPLKTELSDTGHNKAIYTFEEYAHVYFCDLSSTAYHNNKELAILNNRLNLSLLRFDFDNKLHHFRNLKKLYHKSSDLYTSSDFFERRFNSLMISTTLNSKVIVDDFESNKTLMETNLNGSNYAKAWDELYGVFDTQGYLSIFDIRDRTYPVQSISCKNGNDGSIKCYDAQKRDYKLLVSTNRETFIFDIRMNSKPMESRSPIYNGKRKSYTYLEDRVTEVKLQPSTINCTKGYFIDNNRAVILDFVEKTLDLHEFSGFSIQKSLHFGKRLYDMGYNETLGKIAVLLENQEGNSEVAIFNNDLSLDNVLPLGRLPYTKLGFIGSDGKLLIHSNNNYTVYDIN